MISQNQRYRIHEISGALASFPRGLSDVGSFFPFAAKLWINRYLTYFNECQLLIKHTAECHIELFGQTINRSYKKGDLNSTS